MKSCKLIALFTVSFRRSNARQFRENVLDYIVMQFMRKVNRKKGNKRRLLIG